MTRLWLTTNSECTLKPPTRKGHPAVRKSEGKGRIVRKSVRGKENLHARPRFLQIFEEPG
jgi:hypothetical protein